MSVKCCIGAGLHVHVNDCRPDAQATVWERWLSNTQDWCISRQLWWGHRIPAYYVNIPNASVLAALQASLIPASRVSIHDGCVWIVATSVSEAQSLLIEVLFPLLIYRYRYGSADCLACLLQACVSTPGIDIKSLCASLQQDEDVLDTWFSSSL